MSHEPGLHPEPEELELLEQARTAARRAYCPYSRVRVGAALRTAGGRVVLGCNVETPTPEPVRPSECPAAPAAR